MIKAIRLPLDEAPLKYAAAVLREDDGEKRICAVVPTARAMQILSGEPFKTVEIFAVSDFNRYSSGGGGVYVPEQLRPFFLKKATVELSAEDKIAVFKSDNSVFFNDFSSFERVSTGILSFYRETASEMVDTEELAKAGKYTDYEKQIGVLKKLWLKYLEFLKDSGFEEEWERWRVPDFDESFFDRYDGFVFLISGYLTAYELERLSFLGREKDVTLMFNFSGSKDDHHTRYERYLDITVPERPRPLFGPERAALYECSTKTAQLELITLLAFHFSGASGLPMRRMAVIIPDDSVKSHFIRMDYYDIFDVTSGEDIWAMEFYQIFRMASDMAVKPGPDGNGAVYRISDAYKIMLQPSIKALYDGEQVLKKYDSLIKSGRLYLTEEELCSDVFFDRCARFLLANPSRAALSAHCAAVRKFFSAISHAVSETERECFENAGACLQKLEKFYEAINETVFFNEALHMIDKELRSLRNRLPKGKIPVMGLLESRNLCFDIVFLPSMNEDVFPPQSPKDMYLNSEIRRELGLPTYLDRENMLKNYVYQIMERSKYCVISYVGGDSARRRSRFVEELAVKNGLKANVYDPSEISFFKNEKKRFYRPANKPLAVEKNECVLEKLSGFVYSASSLNDYAACPLRFYAKYLAGTRKAPEPEEKLTSAFIGTAFHAALDKVYGEKLNPWDEKFLTVFKETYEERLKTSDAYIFDPVERFRAVEALKCAETVALREEERFRQGWRPFFTERAINAEFAGRRIKGIIDRADSRDGEYEIIDYKFKTIKELSSGHSFEKSEDMQMPLYALLFETATENAPSNVYYFDLKTRYDLVKAFDMNDFSGFKDFLAERLDEIESAEKPFFQTDKVSRCVYCDYAPVCGRN